MTEVQQPGGSGRYQDGSEGVTVWLGDSIIMPSFSRAISPQRMIFL